MIQFSNHSGIHTLYAEQEISTSLEEAWAFFSNPSNLAKITPDHMGFNITTPPAHAMFPGQIITYKVAGLPGIKMNWVTEITHVIENEFFVDEQRFGPYAMWHHEHHFKATDNGILMIDRISYKAPFGIIGRIANALFIKKQLKGIFEYRRKVVEELFC